MKPDKKDKDHIAIDDPTQFPHGDMEELAKKAIKKFKSLSWERFDIRWFYWYFLVRYFCNTSKKSHKTLAFNHLEAVEPAYPS